MPFLWFPPDVEQVITSTITGGDSGWSMDTARSARSDVDRFVEGLAVKLGDYGHEALRRLLATARASGGGTALAT